MKSPALLLTLTLLAPSLAGPLAAHEDDPKLLDIQQPYMGPGYRATGDPNMALSGGSAGPPVQFESSGVTLMSWLTLSDLDGGVSGNDCWGYTSPSGRRYAIMGHSMGCSFVEVTDPGNATFITKIQGSGGLWGDVKVYDEYAYYVSESGGGLVIIDLTGIDQGQVSVVGSVLEGTQSTHNVAVDETSGFLYRCGGAGNGLRIYSLANPADPQLVATWSNRYVHDAQIVTYESGPYAGRQIAFICSGFGNGGTQTRFEVLDVTNKNNIFTRDQVFYSGAEYSHQVWVDEQRQYAYLNDEADEGGGALTRTVVFDISDLDDLSQASTFTNNSKAVGHNLYVKGDFIYEANYRSGLRIFDATNRTQPTEVAYFDTYPANDLATFNGLWSCFPFFSNNTVLGSDREKGLFVLWVGDPSVQIAFPGGVPTEITPAGASVTVSLSEQAVGDLDPSSPRLCYDTGSGPQFTSLVALGGDQYRADLPALPCGSELRWFVSARSSDGIEWRAPAGAPRASVITQVLDGSSPILSYDFESDQGWESPLPGDTAGNGLWKRIEPVGTSGAPNADVTSGAGTFCWATGKFQDVNSGVTNLMTPRLDLSDQDEPWIEFWAWYSAETDGVNSTDRFRAFLSDDDGETWVEVVNVGPNDFRTDFGWFEYRLRVRDYVAATSQVRMRFQAEDDGAPNVVEAAIDEFRVVDRFCSDQGFEPYCTANPNSTGETASIHASGSTSVAENDLVLVADGLVPGQFGLFYYGGEAVSVPFGQGVRCVGAGGAGTFRLTPAELAPESGRLNRALDLTSPPAGSGAGMITAGSVWYFQFWYRDPVGGGFNLSDGLGVRFSG